MTLVAKSLCEREELRFDALLVVWGEVMVGGGT